MDERDYKALNDSLLPYEGNYKGNKETTDKIPTAEAVLKSYLDAKIAVINNADYTFNKVIEAMVEHTRIHLTKQAEVIAEIIEARIKILRGMQANCKRPMQEDEWQSLQRLIEFKQSILQASEEYKQSVK